MKDIRTQAIYLITGHTEVGWQIIRGQASELNIIMLNNHRYRHRSEQKLMIEKAVLARVNFWREE